ncbi:hypothetical protein NPIL_184141 [Nephila pilipes]|uniref:Uncharacterized protein n=1 Tax=Nephila pilipes TaxID=299642 RepID=A0A8X6PYG4_NEPPI|nr:hypothetical protein NPIL_184141 [Nephila pilipes]
MNIKDVAGMTTMSLKKAITGLEDYEEDDISELLAVAKERRKEAERKKQKIKGKRTVRIYKKEENKIWNFYYKKLTD